jgi:hypothetical protein
MTKWQQAVLTIGRTKSMSTVRQLGVFRHLVSAKSFNKTHPGGSFDAGTFKLFGR